MQFSGALLLLALALCALSATAFVTPVKPLSAAGCGVSSRRDATVMMAVPKKRTSKQKTRSRKANWYAKTDKQFLRALSAAKSELNRMAKEESNDEAEPAAVEPATQEDEIVDVEEE
eukprot:CAMPEP_0118850172 /NCGR_PEP_ID=MMETSP1163-20130328/152_1 /TAXON_ID=124430 /ORGANISM="Phaeomonas parva, Strain CCMP2877" /LENGTH=116 /DNA_ID=CAMNT_0006782375 /DNA_START=47 /DNA_END=397 /DNA_ORIENTATION=-